MQRLRSLVKIVLWSVGGLLAVVVLAGAALAVRLASGPIDTSVPQSLLDHVIAEAAPGWHVVAGGAQLDFSSDDGLNGLKLHDVVLSDADGNQVVSAPVLGLRFALAASLDPVEALTVREVALTGASVDVTRDENGAFQMALGDLAGFDGGEPGGGGGVGEAVAGDPMAALGGLGDLGALPRLRIEDAQVRYTDLARGTTWQTDNAQLTLTPSAEGLSGTLGMVIDGGIGGAQLEAFHRTENGEVTATLTLDGVRPSRVAELDSLLAPLARIDAPLSGTVEISADDGGTFRRIAANVTAAEGLVTLSSEPTALNAFAAVFSCAVEAEICDIEDVSIGTADFSGSAKGTLAQSEPGVMALALAVDNASGQLGEARADISEASFTATVDTATGRVAVSRAALAGVSASGLPEGNSASVARVDAVGAFDPETGSVTLSTLAAQNVAITDANGTRQSLVHVTAAVHADLTAERVTITDAELTDLAIAVDGVGVRSPKLVGGAIVDLRGGAVTLMPVVLTDLTVLQAGLAPSKVGTASVAGTIDLAAQTLTDGVVRVRGAVLALPELYKDPVRVDEAVLNLAVAHDGGTTRLTLKSGTARVDGLPATAQGNFAIRANGTALGKIKASLGPVKLANLPKHWPLPVAPGGLRWVASNVRSGVADSLKLTATFDEARPDLDRLDLRFGFREAVVSFVPGMPPIEGAAGTGHVTLDRFDIELEDGSVDAPKAGSLALKGSSFAIADFAPAIPDGQVKLRATGSVQSVLRLLDAEPLGVISPTGFDITSAEGEADVRVLLDLPLADNLRIDDVKFDARAKIHEYSLNEPQTGMLVDGDLLLVKATGEGLTLQSDARIGGLAARLGYAQGFDKNAVGEPESVLTLESYLSLDDFARHGLVLDDYVEGQTAMKARIEMFPGGAARINADADLTNLALSVDRVGWSKPAGVPATVRLSGFRNPDGAGRIEALSLRGEGVSADGSIGFGADGQISRANFARIILGSAVDTGLIYGRKTNGDVGISVEGAQLDLRGAFADALEGEPSPPSKVRGRAKAVTETDINIQVGRVFLRDDLGVFDLKGGIRLRGGELHAANVAGKLNGSAPAKLLAERRRDGLAIRLTAPDAGAFIRATDVFTGAYDGALTLDAIRRDTMVPAQIAGRILINEMVVHDAPTLGRILSGGAIGTLLGDLANGGIKFTKIELPFSGVGPNWRIQDGVAYGPQIGLTLEGGYDVARRKLALNGSISPAYAINGALGNVPLLGALLTGGEGEGVFGVTFSVNGDTNKPEVSVNPLSALAPGFLRKIIAEVGKGASGSPVTNRPPAYDR